MSRDFTRMGALGAAVVAAVAFGAAPIAAAAPAQPDGDPDFTLYAKEVTGDDAEPEPTEPPKAGDSFTFADDFFTSKDQDAERAGREGGVCNVVRTSEQGGEMMCVATMVLTGDRGGQLTGQTLLTYSLAEEEGPAFDIAITGGTGDFADARGEVRAVPDGEFQRFEFHLAD
ncbi:allene oxide cyclase barrel-like domain-containing protein [Streptomyces apocyni]|uniref:allene oxide cyclase barrel-like domain-containing protein n=1 Tax=Streptomyces apocyni TaxID=2654677 RepID=UPI0012E9C682|nr:dirigent protein [Streptomyces apocyni]